MHVHEWRRYFCVCREKIPKHVDDVIHEFLTKVTESVSACERATHEEKWLLFTIHFCITFACFQVAIKIKLSDRVMPWIRVDVFYLASLPLLLLFALHSWSHMKNVHCDTNLRWGWFCCSVSSDLNIKPARKWVLFPLMTVQFYVLITFVLSKNVQILATSDFTVSPVRSAFDWSGVWVTSLMLNYFMNMIFILPEHITMIVCSLVFRFTHYSHKSVLDESGIWVTSPSLNSFTDTIFVSMKNVNMLASGV